MPYFWSKPEIYAEVARRANLRPGVAVVGWMMGVESYGKCWSFDIMSTSTSTEYIVPIVISLQMLRYVMSLTTQITRILKIVFLTPKVTGLSLPMQLGRS